MSWQVQIPFWRWRLKRLRKRMKRDVKRDEKKGRERIIRALQPMLPYLDITDDRTGKALELTPELLATYSTEELLELAEGAIEVLVQKAGLEEEEG